MSEKLSILKKYFGYDSFREGQEPVIDSILSGRDVLAVMPTRSRKVGVLPDPRSDDARDHARSLPADIADA